MKNLLYLLLVLIYTSSLAQEVELETLTSFEIEGERMIGVDDFQSVYYIKDNVLVKKSENQKEYQFSSLQLGNISSVDIINPLKIIVFYETTNTVVVLDNTLTEITRINFTTIPDFRNINQAANAGDRNLWIFNTDLQQLEIYDWNKNKVTTQFPPMETNATSVTNNFNFCWVISDGQVFQYNTYGNFVESHTLEDVSKIAQSGENLIAFAKANLYYKNSRATEFTRVNIPDIPCKDLYLKDEIVYIYTGKEVYTFKIKSVK